MPVKEVNRIKKVVERMGYHVEYVDGKFTPGKVVISIDNARAKEKIDKENGIKKKEPKSCDIRGGQCKECG
jgi:tmRNA-binding protein